MTKYQWPSDMTVMTVTGSVVPAYKFIFNNKDGVEIGCMDFSGASLSFEGNADESAIVFMNHVNKVFQQVLRREYDRGYEDGKDFTQNKTSG